ncbi:MAG: hypothetical protein KatS3mg071_0977 [Meiothermus sp.]|nr:MAG: hypothetical protein KatS3mg071_0977 [Meiothermus sp.]
MTTVSEVSVSPGWRSRLHLIRPRFVYLWVRLWALPIPIFLFAPLVMLELFLMLGAWRLRNSLEALRGQIWELRKMPPFVLLEAEVRPRASQQVYLKIGLW